MSKLPHALFLMLIGVTYNSPSHHPCLSISFATGDGTLLRADAEGDQVFVTDETGEVSCWFECTDGSTVHDLVVTGELLLVVERTATGEKCLNRLHDRNHDGCIIGEECSHMPATMYAEAPAHPWYALIAALYLLFAFYELMAFRSARRKATHITVAGLKDVETTGAAGQHSTPEQPEQ